LCVRLFEDQKAGQRRGCAELSGGECFGDDGTFDTTNLPALAGGLYFNLAYTPTAINLSVAGILGDYNKSGTIDASDYVIWRKTMSQSGPALAADGNNNGAIDPGDFTIWRNNYGVTGAGSGATGSASAIPEPPSLLIILLASTCLALHQQCRRRRCGCNLQLVPRLETRSKRFGFD